MSEVERGGARERDTGGTSTGPTRDDGPQKSSGWLWATRRKQFKNISHPFTHSSSPLCAQSSGVPLSLAC